MGSLGRFYWPDAILYDQYLIPEKVNQTNRLLDDIDCDKIDLLPLLCEGNELKLEYTADGIHLKGGAYQIWAAEILQKLQRLNIP